MVVFGLIEQTPMKGMWDLMAGALQQVFTCTGRVLVLLLCALVLAGCEKFGSQEWNWNQKLTVSVMTPDGIKTGSSVTKAWAEDPPRWSGLGDLAGAMNFALSGEAVVVDLREGRFLFALLKNYGVSSAFKMFFPEEALQPLHNKDLHTVYDKLESTRATKSVSPISYPLLVTFTDIRDPTSLRRVTPTNLALAFGPGFRLHDVSLTITDEAVTVGKISEVLNWLTDLGKKQANLIGKPKVGYVSDQPDPGIYLIAPMDFSTELFK